MTSRAKVFGRWLVAGLLAASALAWAKAPQLESLLRLKVRLVSKGRPVTEGVHFSVTPTNTTSNSAESKPDGTFTLHVRKSDSFRVVMAAPGFAPVSREVVTTGVADLGTIELPRWKSFRLHVAIGRRDGVSAQDARVVDVTAPECVWVHAADDSECSVSLCAQQTDNVATLLGELDAMGKLSLASALVSPTASTRREVTLEPGQAARLAHRDPYCGGAVVVEGELE